jgi:hypothetical protein
LIVAMLPAHVLEKILAHLGLQACSAATRT